MKIGILYCIATAVTAPLLLVMHWLRSNIRFRVQTEGSDSFRTTIVGGAGAPRRGPGPPPPSGLPCGGDPRDVLPHCDAALSKEERVRYLVERLAVEEKISLLGHDSPAIDRPGAVYLPVYKWWNEGLHGFAWTDCCPPREWENVTVFPQVIGLAAAWNRTLWSEVGGAIGTEAIERARGAAGSDDVRPGLTYFTPNINVFRDPRWGRGQETPGEDPYLTSHYAAVMVMSLQYGNEWWERLSRERSGVPDADWRPRVAATCKHFAAYSLETNRFNFSANIDDQRDWDDTYFPAFDACIHAERYLRRHLGREDDGDDSGGDGGLGALGVMCSYNSIDGIPACANPALLKTRLREEWGFRGYVVSDCWAINNIREHHRYAGSYQEAVGMSLRAGVDLDCGDTIQGYGMRALEEGYLDVEDVDDALGNLFGVLMDVGYFEPPTADATGSGGADRSKKRRHDRIAFEAALQSIVLLKNGPDETSPKERSSSSPLPLSAAKHRKISLVGPLADDEIVPLGNYHGVPSKVITPLRGLEDLGVEVKYVHGYDVADGSDEDPCQQMSDDSDATILVMGLNQDIESEEIDRTSLLLPKVQVHMIEEATRCSRAKNPAAPVILVAMTGGPLDLSSYKTNDNIDAILYLGYPGQAGGKALAHVLYGMHNPSGRLVATLYPDAYLDRAALGDMRMRPEESGGAPGDPDEGLYPGRTYRFYDGPAAYPFGHGLSYSAWAYSIEAMTGNGNRPDDGEGRNRVSHVVVTVSNVGRVDGSDSVLLFHEGPGAGSGGVPIKSLIGFEKVHVEAGGARLVTFRVGEWMAAQRAGTHAFLAGPGTRYRLQVDLLEDGVMI